ncbi:hypothetical protein [Marinobacterium aestuariivivens]|uniref:Uncharacterized protein n=1 Tax=Marinobacterium aestuariivivens TaxID=1698799 RepID=A0ABW2A8E9_9GAMM
MASLTFWFSPARTSLGSSSRKTAMNIWKSECIVKNGPGRKIHCHLMAGFSQHFWTEPPFQIIEMIIYMVNVIFMTETAGRLLAHTRVSGIAVSISCGGDEIETLQACRG